MNEQAGKLLAFALLPMIGSGALASDGDGGAQEEVSGYIAAGVDHYGAFHDEDGEESTTRGVLRNAKLQVELAWGSRVRSDSPKMCFRAAASADARSAASADAPLVHPSWPETVRPTARQLDSRPACRC